MVDIEILQRDDARMREHLAEGNSSKTIEFAGSTAIMLALARLGGKDGDSDNGGDHNMPGGDGDEDGAGRVLGVISNTGDSRAVMCRDGVSTHAYIAL
jgi:serine/threonine protein phosphatase PrpC